MEADVRAPKVEEVKRGICVIWENLQCPICLDLMSSPVSTKCDHQFCRYCIMKMLQCSKKQEVSCPICKAKVTKRSLQASPGFEKLVEGLKNVVEAFEEDTCTQYFTEVSPKLESPGVVKKAPSAIQLNKRQAVSVKCHNNKTGKTQSGEPNDVTTFSEEVKNAFAKLMGIEDSCTLISDKEDLENAVNDIPQDSGNGRPKKNIRHSLSAPETQVSCVEKSVAAVNENSQSVQGVKSLSTHDTLLQGRHDSVKEETIKHKTKGQFHRRGRKGDEVVLNERQNKSLEKVSEWLLNIPQSAEGESDPDLQGSIQNNSEDCLSDRHSLLSTAKGDQDEEQMTNPKIRDRNQCLEEKVFGVVYKRDRRSTRAQLKTCSSPKGRDLVQLPASGPTEETRKKRPKKRLTNNLTPADFIKRPCTELEKDQPVTDPSRENGSELHVASESSCAKSSKDLDGTLLETGALSGEKEEVKYSPAFDVPVQGKRKKSKVNLKNNWQEVTDVFLEASQRLTSENRKRESCLALKRPLKSTKPLELISVAVDDSGLMTNPSKVVQIEAEVQIESYPSSEDQGLQFKKSFRRSSRLQAFTNEVQGCRRKSLPVSTKRNVEPDSTNKQLHCQTTHGEAVNKISKPKDGTQKVMRNGCVAFVDATDIEKVELDAHVNTERNSKEKIDSVQCGSPPPVSSLEDLEDTYQCLAVDLLEVSHNSKKCKSNTSTKVLNLFGNFSSEKVSAELDEDKNSELDTEQLLKTFKTTKRRSFCIGSPSNKCSDVTSINSARQTPEQQHEEDGEERSVKKLESCSVASSVELVQHNAKALTSGPEGCSVHTNDNASTCSSDLSHSVLHPESEKSRLYKPGGALLVTSPYKPGELEKRACMDVCNNHHSQLCMSSTDVIKSHGDGPPPRKRNKLSSRHYISSEAVGSEPLFGTFEEEPQDLSGSGTEEQCVRIAKASNPVDFAETVQACSRDLAEDPQSCGTNDVVESSVTPDDLLPPNVAFAASIDSVVTSRLKSKVGEEEGPVEPSSQVNLLRKRKRPRRLESSDSEGSGEDIDLPSLAELFGLKGSHQPTIDKSAKQRSEDPSLKVQTCPEEPSRCVASPPSKATATGAGSLQPSDPEWVPASQTSVDLFGTQEDCAAGPCTAALSGQSSQFSSEIICTQQKMAMHEELRRLEKMMALVTEALRQKESPHGLLSSAPADDGLLNPGATSADQPRERNVGVPKHSPQAAQAPVSTLGGRSSGCVKTAISPLPAPVATESSLSYTTGRRRGTRHRGSHSRKSRVTGGNEEDPTLVTQHQEDDAVHRKFEETPKGATVVEADSEKKLHSRPSTGGDVATTPLNRSCSPAKSSTVVLVASGLSSKELSTVKKFAKKTGASVCPQVTPQTTHVVIRTDQDLVCERTLKYFLGIAGRKWVVSFHWIAECFKQRKVLDEVQFEVRGDVATGVNHRGPMRARTTDDQKLLMRGLELCFLGPFTDMSTGQMEWMAELCGATVVKDPCLFAAKHKSNHQLVVVQPGPGGSLADYKELKKKVTLVTRDWLLDSVATYTLRSPEEYRL